MKLFIIAVLFYASAIAESWALANLAENGTALVMQEGRRRLSAASLQNHGKNCWRHCNGRGGYCSSYCGAGNACCRQNWNADPAECNGVSYGAYTGYHTCVSPGQRTCTTVTVGSNAPHATAKPKSVTVPGLQSYETCPSLVNKKNWLGTATYKDTFNVAVHGTKVTVTRINSRHTGWGMNLKFQCCGHQPPPFTVIFFSDLECNYRGRTMSHCQRVMDYLLDLGNKQLYYSGANSNIRVDPKLFLHGGDINRDNWKAGYDPFKDPSYFVTMGRRTATNEYNDLWYKPFMKGIPTLTVFGNHDWSYPFSDYLIEDGYLWSRKEQHDSNTRTDEFIKILLRASKKLGVTVKEFGPKGQFGPTHYIAEYNGIQIVLLQDLDYNKSYDWDGNNIKRTYWTDGQLKQVRMAIDYSKTTIVMTHRGDYLLDSGNQTTWISPILEDMLKNFPNTQKAAVFRGHTHIESHNKIGDRAFDDYVAAYPHIYKKNKPGAYAILVSPSKGILEVKSFEIKAKCWPDGTKCTEKITCKTECCDNDTNWSYWYSLSSYACGTGPKSPDGTQCIKGKSCNACKNPATYWYGKTSYACGPEPKYPDGTQCFKGSSCNACKKPATYWYGKAFTACGPEPKYPDGTQCFKGSSCNACKNPATYWYGPAFTACGPEPKYPDGTRCGLGSSCNACKNSATHWTGKGYVACGREPCWPAGTTCGAGTTCNSCCNKGKENCPWYQLGVCTCG